METPEHRQAVTEPVKPEEWQRFEDFSKRLLRVPASEIRDLRKTKTTRTSAGDEEPK